MKDIKICSAFAAFGFILSFITGLFSHTAFISILLKAFLFAICFGILGFGISLVFQKFLADSSSSEFSTDTSVPAGKNSPGLGQVVDITIQDEDLVNSESENHFFVNNSHQMLNDSDTVKQENEQKSENSESNGFVPLKDFENYKNVAGKEAVHPDSVESNNDKAKAESMNIDTLPEMNSLSFEDNNNSSSDDVETDAGFVSSANMNKSSDEQPEIKDAALMAKAISSILSDEDE